MCDVHLALSVDLENNNDNRGYVPARNLGEMNIKSFVSALSQHGETHLKSLFNDTYLRYSDAYASLFDVTQNQQQNTKISSLIWKSHWLRFLFGLQFRWVKHKTSIHLK